MMLRRDGSRAQAGMGPLGTPTDVRRVVTGFDAYVLRVIPAGHPDNLSDQMVADVVSVDGDKTWPQVKIVTANPRSRVPIKAGDRCLVWFLGGRFTQPFIFGFSAFNGDLSSSTMPDEDRMYHQSGAMRKIKRDGQQEFIAKNRFGILVEDMQ
jgi:hypothetical protein